MTLALFSLNKAPTTMSILLRFGLLLLLSFTWNHSYAQTYPQLLIPAYGNPCCDAGKAMWENLLSSAQSSKIPLHIIFNPASGSGSSRDPNYLNEQGEGVLAEVHNAGAVIYAYVASHYAKKPLDAIKAELDAYFEQFYQGVIDGVFIDEMSNDLKDVGYYQNLYAYIKEKYKNAPIMGNPGTADTENSSQQSRYSIDDYASSVDILITFEDSQAEYNTYQAPTWLQTDTKNQAHAYIGQIIHSATGWSSELEQQIIKNQSDFIYITSDTLDNPYDSLSKYWTELLALIERLALKDIYLLTAVNIPRLTTVP